MKLLKNFIFIVGTKKESLSRLNMILGENVIRDILHFLSNTLVNRHFLRLQRFYCPQATTQTHIRYYAWCESLSVPIFHIFRAERAIRSPTGPKGAPRGTTSHAAGAYFLGQPAPGRTNCTDLTAAAHWTRHVHWVDSDALSL